MDKINWSFKFENYINSTSNSNSKIVYKRKKAI